MKIRRSRLPGLLLIEPAVHLDARGFFYEAFRAERYVDAGIPPVFEQDNVSFSEHGVLRGIHLQWPKPQGKLIYVLQGEIFDVAVDLRPDSATFRQWESQILSGENNLQIWVPPGYGHGFLVTGRNALVAYKCTSAYDRTCELAVRWDDPDLGIEWPNPAPSLSPKDRAAPLLKNIPSDRLPGSTF